MDNTAMVTKTTSSSSWILVGSELSPFTLKLMALFDYVGLPYRTLPDEGSTWENLKMLLRKELLVRGYLPQLWPKRHALDEYPLVPFLFGDKGENLFDSSAIAYWLDHGREDSMLQPRCLPQEDEDASFICHLLDEYADEYGLYMVHHNRWVLSASDNNAGQRLARELRRLLGPFQRVYAHWFSARQIKRLPYLFSVAEDGAFLPGLSERRQPPSRPGFPPTQTLLNQSFERLLRALDALLTLRPYVLGDRFTLADASLYGQLAMNLKDPSACAQIRQQAPVLYEWLIRIQARQFAHHAPVASPDWKIDEALTPLIHEVCRTYVPLMQQNMAAWQQYQNTGETLYNEKAFWRNRSLYDGKIDGQPFRAVVKSFQVLTWARLIKHWHALSADQKQRLIKLFPELQVFEKEELPSCIQP